MKSGKNDSVICVWFVALLVVIGGWFAYVFVDQQSYLNNIDREYVTAKARLDEAKAKNAELKNERDELDDPGYIEKVAREDLGMTRQGEMPYIAPKKDK